jgi:hypothetical protein
MDDAGADALAAAYKGAREHVEAAVINEKDTLDTVNELASDKPRVAAHVAALQKAIEQAGAAQLAALDVHMKASAARLKVAPVVLKPSDLETAAAAMVPKPTPKVTADGYQGYRQHLTGIDLARFRGLDTTELSRLVNGRHSVLDIRKMLEAQAPVSVDLQKVVDYVGALVKAGLVEMPPPAPAKTQKPVRK